MTKSAVAVVVSVCVLILIVLATATDAGVQVVGGVIGGLSGGLFAAVAAFALSAYVDRRDPTLLLVGVGAAALVAHDVVVYGLFAAVQPDTGEAWTRLLQGYQLAGLLVLLGNLLVVVPFRERRGRLPLQPGLPIAASVAALVTLDVIAVSVSQPADPFSVALVVGGAIVAVRSLRWHGRFGWVAAAGAALAVVGLAVLVGLHGTGDGPVRFASAWGTGSQTIAAAALVAFVIAGLHLDTSRMRRTSDRATQVMEGRAEIASVVAHDVRGPAGTIRSIAGSLRTSYDRLDDAQRLEFVGMVEQESMRLLRVADQMSLGLRADADTLPMSPVDRELEAVVLQGLHDAEPGQREVRIDADDSLHGPIDARWLAEAVRQGVENAIKYSPADTPIDLRLYAAGGDAVIEIEDRGPGIPPELDEQVFEKFCRWRPAGYEDVSGSGLGLFITRQIARAQGGDATVARRADGGTILQIRLPIEVRRDG